MTTCLITGGAGFIGSSLARTLLEHGHPVRILDNFATGRRENLDEIAGDIELVEADLRDPVAVSRAVGGAAVIYHLGALGSVPRSMQNPAETHDVNVNGTLNVLVAAQKNSARVVLASSSSVYGDSTELPQHERLPLRPISPYAASKATGELYCYAFSRAYGIETACLRYFNVFGPRQDPTSQYAAAIPRFVSALLGDRPPTIFGDGEQSRGFTYVDDVVDATIRAGTRALAGPLVANISSNAAVTVNHVVMTLQKLLAKEHIDPAHTTERKGDIKHSLADIALACQALGYEPRFTFEQGIEKAIDWYRIHLHR
jgi:nucleoside-diphosphate-sugar epimerase